jgi:hypothetical protein
MATEDARRLVYVHPSTPVGDASRARLLERFGDTPPTVVVLDSLGMGMGLSAMDSNSDTDTARWANEVIMWLKGAWPGAVILVVDHLPKAGGSEPIGSQRKGALADALFRVETVSPFTRRVTGSCRVTVEKDRRGWFEAGKALFDVTFGGGVPFTIAEADPGSVVLSLGDAVARQRQLAEYVGEHEGCRVEDARKAVNGRTTEFSGIKDTLVAAGVIEHPPRAGLFKGPSWSAFMAQDRQ